MRRIKLNKIFSGVQPTGNLHIGNYLGAIKNFVDLQKNNEDTKAYYCVVDLHAITVWQEPKKLEKNILETAAIFLAAGIDPEKSIIFNQSKVSCHAELAWIFNCICKVGWLNRMTQFKEKAGKNKEKVSVGLYTYPVLMAADILAYKANLVPVGEDQKQHLELARDIAQKFNYDFKTNYFPEINPLILPNTARVMSLRNGRVKMSKSDLSQYSRINILDNKDDIKSKIKKAKTDSENIMGLEALDHNEQLIESVISNRPEAVNLIQIYCSCANIKIKDFLNLFEGKTFSIFKEELAEVLIEIITPIGDKVKKMLKDRQYIYKVLQEGAEVASDEANNNLKEIKKIIGLI